MHTITYEMLQRECILIAYRLGLESSYQNTQDFRFDYDVVYDNHGLEYKDRFTVFSNNDLSMSLDDFAEKIIYPFLLSCLTDDLKFIHLDCT